MSFAETEKICLKYCIAFVQYYSDIVFQCITMNLLKDNWVNWTDIVKHFKTNQRHNQLDWIKPPYPNKWRHYFISDKTTIV